MAKKTTRGWQHGTIMDANGTSLQGYVDISYAELVEAFGEPDPGDGFKVDAEWTFLVEDTEVLDTPSGLAAVTIYNWKDGPSYGGMPVEDIRDWHIGGHNERAVLLAKFVLGLEGASLAHPNK